MNKWSLFIFFLLMLSCIFMTYTNHWVMMWMMMEMNMLSFMVNLTHEKNKESTLLFFLLQTLSSMAILMYMFIEETNMNSNPIKTLSYLMMMAIMLKVGMFPFHSWMMEISMNMYWLNISILLTWQKIIPLIMLMNLTNKLNMNKITIFSMTLMSMIILSVSSTKKIIILSSLTHNGWMIMSMKFIKNISLIYITLYSMMLLLASMFLMKNNIKKISYQLKEKKSKINLTILMFSIAGMPPSVGFFLKMSVIFSLIKNKLSMMMMIMLIMVSSMSFMAYLQMFMKIISMMKNNNTKKLKLKKSKKSLIMWVNMVTPMLMMY